jgi:hypothetical protein
MMMRRTSDSFIISNLLLLRGILLTMASHVFFMFSLLLLDTLTDDVESRVGALQDVEEFINGDYFELCS